MKNIKPLFAWVKANGDGQIVNRVLLHILPELLKYNIELTDTMIETSQIIKVPNELYEIIDKKVEELVLNSSGE